MAANGGSSTCPGTGNKSRRFDLQQIERLLLGQCRAGVLRERVLRHLLYSVTSFWQQILRFLRQQEEALSHIGTRLPKGNSESLEPEEPASRGHARAGKPRVSSDCSDFQPLRRQSNSIDSTTTGGTELQQEFHRIVAHTCSEAER